MNIYTGLLFQQGHIHDPKLAQSLAGAEPVAPARVGGDGAPPRRSKPDKPKAIKAFRRGAIASVCSVALSPFR